MTVFRVEKTENFTVMSNHHLRNKELSLKAKVLLSLMLSLPEDWDYTAMRLMQIFETAPETVSKIAGESESQMPGRNRRKRDVSVG